MTDDEYTEMLDGILRASKNLRYLPRDSKLWHLARKRICELVEQLGRD